MDINADGQLGRDEFAVALHLIHARQEGGLLPRTLPPGLVPPSPRKPNTTTHEESVSNLSTCYMSCGALKQNSAH